MSSDTIFISYSHDKDLTAYMENVCQYLKQYGIKYWLDVENGIKPSDDNYNKVIEDAIKSCNYFACIWTRGVKESEVCLKELSYMLSLARTEPNRKCYILKMEPGLNKNRDFPDGLNMRLSGKNILDSIGVEQTRKAVEGIVNDIESHLVEGVGFDDFRNSLRNKIDSMRLPCNTCVSRLVSDKTGKEVEYSELAESLSEGNNVSVLGARGMGKTNVVKNVYNVLCERLKKSLSKDVCDLVVPLYVDLEVLWDWTNVSRNSILYRTCEFCEMSYCTDKSVHYVVLLDGEMETSRGYLPDRVDYLFDDRSGVVSVLLAQTDLQFLDQTRFSNYVIEPLSYEEIVKYVLIKMNSVDNVQLPDQGDIKSKRFFDRLLYKAFPGNSPYEPTMRYFNQIKEIYNIFKRSACENDTIGSYNDKFYSVTLARSTQRGRLPSGLSDYQIEIWRKLIRGNEVFRGIRNPYYLNWLIDLYLSDNQLVFPYLLKTLQVKICQTVLDRIRQNREMRKKAYDIFLIPLANFLAKKNGANKPVSILSFQNENNHSDFERIKKLLVESHIINVACGDVVFRHDFYFDYFLNCADPSQANTFEDKLRVCPLYDLPNTFLSYVKLDTPYDKNVGDPIEVASDIVCCERDKFVLTETERETLLSIASRRISESIDYHQKASILNGIGKLFGTLVLSLESDELTIENSELWVHLDDSKVISRFPITFFHYDIFVKEGYSNPSYWKMGREMIRMKTGEYRNRPLEVDVDRPQFHISNHPVVGISWYEALAFCAWLEERLGREYKVRLPKVEEVVSFMEESYLNDIYNSQSKERFNCTTPISTFGNLHDSIVDILGNVWEWSANWEDFYDDAIVRCYGGGWNCKVTKESYVTTYPAKLSSNNIGFRVIVERISEIASEEEK